MGVILALLVGVAACEDAESPSGSGGGGSGGATATTGPGGLGGEGGQGGAFDCDAPDEPAPVSASWCERLPAGPAGANATPIDLSAAHAQVRFFGPVVDYTAADQALAAALVSDEAWSGEDLSAYAAALPGVVCAREAASSAPALGAASVEMVGEVAIISPGTGPVELPDGTKAALVDLRDLPWAAGLREAILAAVSPALATPVPGLQARVRKHQGMVDEVFSAQNVYKNSVATVSTPEIPAAGAADLPLAVLTGPSLPPEAVEIAAALRLAKRAWLVGEGLRIEVAEARWQGVGASGVAHRGRDLLAPGTDSRLPDAIEADRRRAHPECFAAEILALGPIPEVALGDAARPQVLKTLPFGDEQPKGDPLGDARAALVIAHGATRTFYPYFGTVPDIIDDRLLETTSALPVSPTRLETYHSLRRFGNALTDGHQFVFDHEPTTVGYFAVHIEDIDGALVVRRSATPGVDPGDTITSIGGTPADEYLATELARSGGASEGYQIDIATRQLTSMKGPVELGLVDAAGAPKTVLVEPQPVEEALAVWVASSRPAGHLGDLGAPELYYINLHQSVLTTTSAFSAALVEAAGSQGIVLDMRGYPGIDHYTAARRLMLSMFSSPIFRVPVLTGPDEVTVDESSIALSPLGSPSYSGPIVLMVGHHTVSAAENFSTMLVDGDRVTVIGRQSAATNGNITGAQLPGSFGFSFTGMEVRHADAEKSVFHGVGIVPDIEVPLSAAAFAAGDDPELEAAISYLLQN